MGIAVLGSIMTAVYRAVLPADAPGAESLLADFRTAVRTAADAEPEGEPGRLCRAYIRVSFAEADSQELRDLIAVTAQLMGHPDVRALAEADGRRWRDELAADGLPLTAVRMIVAATDGVSSAPLWGPVLDADDRAALEAELLALTRP